MMKTPEIKIFCSANDVALEFAKYFTRLCNEYSKNGKDFYVALSGGSTPEKLFKILGEKFGHKIEWNKVHFYWGDERCVPQSNQQSNFRLVKDLLLNKIDIPKTNIHAINGALDPDIEVMRYQEDIKNFVPVFNGFPQFDLVILGLGEDGHVASIFPNQIDMFDSRKFCEVATHPDTGQKRISLTGKIINNAARVAFLVTGRSKALKVDEVINRKGEYHQYPASKVKPVGETLWFLDSGASQNLPYEEVC